MKSIGMAVALLLSSNPPSHSTHHDLAQTCTGNLKPSGKQDSLKLFSLEKMQQQEERNDNSNDDDSKKEMPQLLPADPNKDIPSITFGETLRFDELGPIIINTDGTTRRIENWSEMTEKEKEVTWRRIGKRNEERRNMLLQQQEQQSQQQEKEKTSKEL